MLRVLAFCLLFGATVLAKHEIYQGWKAYWITPETKEEQTSLIELSDSLELDWIQHALVGREGLALVKPVHVDGFLKGVEDLGLKYRVHAEDVKTSLDSEDEVISLHRRQRMARNGGKTLPYDVYPTFAEINQYMVDIAAQYPNTVKLHHRINSFDGRPLYYLTISTSNFEDTNKPVIFIDGGIHAREWVSPPTVTYSIHKLVANITEGDLVDNIDWILMPVVNPDGYDYTFTNERFWRKTRSTDPNLWITSICPGVDGNRNYDFEWNTVGTSVSACGDTYAGQTPFSEPETRLVRDLVLENLDHMALYLTMHSYGSMILYPWGHTGLVSSEGLALHKVGVAMGRAIDALKIPGYPDYAVGNSVSVIGYGAAGASEDWAHSVGVKLSYTYELPGLGGGYVGFNPDPRLLEQIVTETWEGIVVGARLAVAHYRRTL